MKKILGLDIGSNSIGWAFLESNVYENPEILNGKIIQLGSRIIPMDADAMNKFETGNPESKAAGRRQARGARRLNQRYKLRRGRLIEALKILEWVPREFPTSFKKLGKYSINAYLPFSDTLKNEAAEFFGILGDKTTKGNDYGISEDWLIYFLKTKALNTQVTLPELARILYHYNQRRGFKSSRKDNKTDTDETEQKKQEEWVEILEVTNIAALNKGEGKDKDFTFFEITCKTADLEFTAIKKRINPPDWLNKSIEFRVTKKVTKDGTVTYNIYDIDPNAWESRKRAWEKYLVNEGKHISVTYLNELRKDRNFKVKQRIVDRHFYQDEFKAIWEKQSNFYKKEFEDLSKISDIADNFYTHNKDKNREIKSKDLFHLFFTDIIYYQRKLKSQKGLLANCQYENKAYKTKDKEIKEVGVQVTSRSSPAFQEFRIWQTIHNLKIIKKEEVVNNKLRLNVDVSNEYLTVENKEKIFELFDSAGEVTHDSILKLLGFKKDKVENGERTFYYNLNYTGESFPGNETKSLFRKVFKKHEFIEEGEKYLSDKQLFHHLWHIVYSLPEEKEIISALKNLKYFSLPESIIKHISKLPEFKSQYASLSTKAINKLLPLMRIGKFWNESDISSGASNRITKVIDGEFDESISNKTREEILKLNLTSINQFQGLPTFVAAYIVYGRHSERANESKYENIDDFRIKEIIPYNSLRNPVVEKVIRETLSLVKDIWKNANLGRPDYIHVELGREMKNNNEDRKKIAESNTKNRIEKERIANLLKELNYPNFNADSPFDIDKFRVWKDNGGREGDEIFETLFKKNNAEFVKDADIQKYKHWAEQNYRSPYTGKAIPLSELFTEKYQIDHIIPRAKFYDDSFGNKVVVEAEVNALKDNRLAIQFIDDWQGRDINLSNGKIINVSTLADYKAFTDTVFTNKKKKLYLKLYEVPEDFVERQMNDTKYISRTVAQYLRPIALGNDSDEGVVYTSGSITSDLKHKWGLNKLWKEILKPRFERLEHITGDTLIFQSETKQGDYHFGKDYKRIDHRHHAIDALVVACTSRSHIKYLNSLNSLSNNKNDIAKYGEWQKWKYLLNKKKKLENQESGMTEFATPWEGFYLDTKEAVEVIVVSHKPTNKLISKAINKYYKWHETEPGKWEKKIHFQNSPVDDDKYWVAVRQSLFGQPYGKIYIAEYKKGVELKAALKAQMLFLNRQVNEWNTEDWRVAKSFLRKQIDSIIKRFSGDEKEILRFLAGNPLKDEEGNVIEALDLLHFRKYASKKVVVDESFTKDKIEKMPYSNLKKNWLTNLLKQHLLEYGDDPKVAFKGEALEMLNRKAPYPINKVTRKESGEKIERNNKLLDGDAGVNQYFVVEIKKETNKKTGEEKTVRKYSTPNFLDCIERLAKGLHVHNEDPNSKYIVLSPGDLVYVPPPGNQQDFSHIDWSKTQIIAGRTYIMKSSSETKCYFLPAHISNLILQYDAKTKKGEFESTNKSEKTIDGIQLIKENFVKLKIDRLGNISLPSAQKNYAEPAEQSAILREPETLYEKTGLQKFSSFEEMEDDQLKHFASLSPQQSLESLRKLQLKVFGNNADISPDRTIKFDTPDEHI